MIIALRVFCMMVSAVAAYYYTYWVGGASLLSGLPPWGLFAVSVATGLLVAVAVWMLTSAGRRGFLPVMVVGALTTGGISFCAGFFGPMLLTPQANQGPMLGFVTGPLGLAVGALGGIIYWVVRGRHAKQTTDPRPT